MLWAHEAQSTHHSDSCLWVLTAQRAAAAAYLKRTLVWFLTPSLTQTGQFERCSQRKASPVSGFILFWWFSLWRSCLARLVITCNFFCNHKARELFWLFVFAAPQRFKLCYIKCVVYFQSGRVSACGCNHSISFLKAQATKTNNLCGANYKLNNQLMEKGHVFSGGTFFCLK